METIVYKLERSLASTAQATRERERGEEEEGGKQREQRKGSEP
jgi:hypothetical protein